MTWTWSISSGGTKQSAMDAVKAAEYPETFEEPVCVACESCGGTGVMVDPSSRVKERTPIEKDPADVKQFEIAREELMRALEALPATVDVLQEDGSTRKERTQVQVGVAGNAEGYSATVKVLIDGRWQVALGAGKEI